MNNNQEPFTENKYREIVERLENEIDSILDAIHDDILITDEKGIVIKVSATFEEVYGISKQEAIGTSVYEMEQQGLFKPSVTAEVLKTGEKVTMRQKNRNNRDIVVTATPVKDENGTITKVISFSRDITELLNLQEQYTALENKVERYEEELETLRSNTLSVEGVVTKSAASQEILKTISRIAKFDVNVLLTGESGVGKTLFAKVIHKKSTRASGPFIEINCGAIPENLLESELFGYEKGSFTGANREGKVGLIELAQNGTLFLDEISELSLGLQVKILKVIQDKKITRVGGIHEIQVDFRLIAATNKNLPQLMENGAFREDLYYRLNVISIEIPPLRERKMDIVQMITFFINRMNEHYHLKKVISKEAFDLLIDYSWPGNVRELENVIERIMLTTEEDQIMKADLPQKVLGKDTNHIKERKEMGLYEAVAALEEEYVKDAYEQYGTTVGVAQKLGISQPTAVRKIKKYVRNAEK